jgi:hypothetical protein
MEESIDYIEWFSTLNLQDQKRVYTLLTSYKSDFNIKQELDNLKDKFTKIHWYLCLW